MSSRKKRLGRGLDALLSGSARTDDAAAAPAADAATPGATPGGEAVRELPLDLLERGQYQPRHVFDEAALDELASSIRAQGVVQPIVVREIAGGRFEIIAGERRWRAAGRAGLETVPAVVRDVADEAALAMALIENIQREDLNALDEAQALDRLQREFSLTQQELADAVGKSRTTVANLIRLLDLSDAVANHLAQGDIDMGHARALLPLPATEQLRIARQIIAGGLSVRQAEALVQRARGDDDRTRPAKPAAKDPDVARLETDLADRLGAPVEIRQKGKGGSVTIRYTSLDELDGILEKIR